MQVRYLRLAAGEQAQITEGEHHARPGSALQDVATPFDADSRVPVTSGWRTVRCHRTSDDPGTAAAAPRGLAARSRWLLLAISLLLLAPCYWQPRIQAGDLSSHIYNSWLAQLIESGRAQGLMVKQQTTNVLFDLILSGLFKAFGAEAAQRIAVSRWRC